MIEHKQALDLLDLVVSQLYDEFDLRITRDGSTESVPGGWRWRSAYTEAEVAAGPTLAEATWAAVAALASQEEQKRERARSMLADADQRLVQLRQLQVLTPENLAAAEDAMDRLVTKGSIAAFAAKVVGCDPDRVEVVDDQPATVVVRTPLPNLPADPVPVGHELLRGLRERMPAGLQVEHYWLAPPEPDEEPF